MKMKEAIIHLKKIIIKEKGKSLKINLKGKKNLNSIFEKYKKI